MGQDEKYDKIINLPHFEPKNHPRMQIEARAAQFAPFSPLDGYEEGIDETARITSDRIEISEDEKEIINNKIRKIKESILSKPKATITYFIPDSKKEGGKYVDATGLVKRIDEDRQLIILENKTEISINEIATIWEN